MATQELTGASARADHGSLNEAAHAPTPSSAPSISALAASRSWSFVDRRTGESRPYTCMIGCTINHSDDMGRPLFPEDIWCWCWDESLTLPVNESGRPEEFRVLSTVIKVEPWSPKIAERLPYAVVELVDEHYIDGLDPDGLATVINTLSARIERMWATHRRLVEIRARYSARSQASSSEEVA